MTNILMAVDVAGRVRCAQTQEDTVPDGFVQPGEIAFVLHPLDIRAMHTHGLGAVYPRDGSFH